MQPNPLLLSGMSVTIEEAIRQAADAFTQHKLCFGHGTDNASDEAYWLVLHALGLSPLVPPNYSAVLTPVQLERCNQLLNRRIVERLPAAYLTGKAWFAGLEFRSDERALVPRSPLGEFINDAFFDFFEDTMPQAVLDLCTGGGCIAIACAMVLPEAQVDASDLSAEALSLAAQNVSDYELEDRVTLLQGSLFEPIKGRYDLIISNPPYVDSADINGMGDEFRHEPMMGLAAGEDGLDLVRIMLRDAAEHLSERGILVVEVGNSAQALEQTYPEVPFLWLDFEFGGSGVFVLTREELQTHAQLFEQRVL